MPWRGFAGAVVGFAAAGRAGFPSAAWDAAPGLAGLALARVLAAAGGLALAVLAAGLAGVGGEAGAAAPPQAVSRPRASKMAEVLRDRATLNPVLSRENCSSRDTSQRAVEFQTPALAIISARQIRTTT